MIILFHVSTEGKVLEDPKNSPPEFIFQKTVSPEKAKINLLELRLVLKIVIQYL